MINISNMAKSFHLKVFNILLYKLHKNTVL